MLHTPVSTHAPGSVRIHGLDFASIVDPQPAPAHTLILPLDPTPLLYLTRRRSRP